MSDISDLIDAQIATLAEIAVRFGLLQGTWTQIANWAAGTVDGGPDGDGYYPMTDAAGVTRMLPSIAKIRAGIVGTEPMVIAATAVTLNAAHAGRRLVFTAATAVTVTVPAGLGNTFECQCWQKGAGLVSFLGDLGVTNGTRTGASESAGQGALMGVSIIEDAGGVSTFLLGGDVV